MVSAPNSEHLEGNSRDITRNMLQNDGSLLIFYTRVADQGMYKCIATNMLGHDVGKVNLTVREGEISLRLESLGKEGSPHVRESQTIFDLDSGFHAMDSGFQVLDSGWFFVSGTWIPDSDRKWNSGFLELYSGFYINIFPDSGTRIPLLKWDKKVTGNTNQTSSLHYVTNWKKTAEKN